MTIRPKRRRPAPLEDSVLQSIRRINRAIDLYSRQLSAACHLTGPQLACLRQLEGGGPVTMSELAAVVSLSPATVSGILDRLESRGLIARERQVEDKRRVLVRLTPAGLGAVRDAPPPLQEQFSRRFRALSSTRQAALDRALRQIVAMMEADDIDVAPLLVPPRSQAGATRR